MTMYVSENGGMTVHSKKLNEYKKLGSLRNNEYNIFGTCFLQKAERKKKQQ